MSSSETTAVVSTSTTANTGLSINLHPLPILNISEHHLRNSLQRDTPRSIGALLGTQSGREVSVINTFELAIKKNVQGDIEMTGQGSSSPEKIDMDFLERRREQYKEVFPTLELLGWYTTDPSPSSSHVALHNQFLPVLESPLFLLLSPTDKYTQDLPITIYESALGPTSTAINTNATVTSSDDNETKFIPIAYSVETGEAERIAVDGAFKGLVVNGSGDGEGTGEEFEGEDGLVAHLNTQRNAIKMLHDRIKFLLKYVSDVISGEEGVKVDHSVLRKISALVAGLPIMSSSGFRDEFLTEYADVQLTAYLATLTKQVAALSDLTDKFNTIHGPRNDDPMGMIGGQKGAGRFTNSGAWGAGRPGGHGGPSGGGGGTGGGKRKSGK